ncbi:MAG: LLM class flavin-dependent oxidoreductase [Chloroflexota bacterium]
MEDNLTHRERIGFNVRRGRASRAVELIQRAESEGISTVWMTMGAFGSDTLTLYAAAATKTISINLGASIVPAFTRHPFTTVSQALVLDDLAPGRLRLGVGTSHGPVMERSFGVPFDKPLTQLREYLQILRPALHEGQVEFSGDYYNVKGRFPGAPGTPVLISALGVKAFETAGELTDGAISWLVPLSYLRETAIPAMERGAQRGNREKRPAMVAHVSVALADDESTAFAAARKEFSLYSGMPFYQQMFAKTGYPLTDDGEYTDELLRELVVHGDEATISSTLKSLLDHDFDELIVMPVPVDDRETEEARLLAMIGRL